MGSRLTPAVALAIAAAVLTAVGGASSTFHDARWFGSVVVAVNLAGGVTLVVIPRARVYLIVAFAVGTTFLTVLGLLSFGLALAPGAALWLAALVLALRDVRAPRLAVAVGALTVGVVGNGLLLVALVS